MLCSSSALSALSTKVNPLVESATYRTSSSPVPVKPVGDLHVGGVVMHGNETELDRRRVFRGVAAPRKDDPAVLLYFPDEDPAGHPVHLPLPDQLGSWDHLPAALRVPDLPGDVRVNDGLEHVVGRPANAHADFDRGNLRKLKCAFRHGSSFRRREVRPSCVIMQPSGCLSFIGSQSAACQGAAWPSRPRGQRPRHLPETGPD